MDKRIISLAARRQGQSERHMEAQVPALITVEEAAYILGIGRTAAWKLVRKRELRSVKIGHSRRVVRESVYDYIECLGNEAA
jgi:excisionase family DNA binding protein